MLVYHHKCLCVCLCTCVSVCVPICTFMFVYMYEHVYTIARKCFDRKYFIDNKNQGKIFSWIHDFLEIILP